MRMLVTLAALAILSTLPAAAEPARLTVELSGVTANGDFATPQAFCAPTPDGKSTGGPNVSPAVRWTAGPAGTKSYALALLDPHVPADLSALNKDGVTIAADAARQDFFHWVLADIPAGLTAIPEGAEGRGVVAHGKPAGPTGHGRRGANDYGRFLAGDPQMAGIYGGYDGPCPPWNDQRVHGYRLTVYALDTDRLNLADGFDGRALIAAINGHVTAQGTTVVRYTLNPALRR
jgi:Raf kinase inhibitor-like YbhB/YbcL family protein